MDRLGDEGHDPDLEETQPLDRASAMVLLGELRRDSPAPWGLDDADELEAFSLDAPPLADLGATQVMPHLVDEPVNYLSMALAGSLVLVASLVGVLAGLAVG